jgi:hypothetical protein
VLQGAAGALHRPFLYKHEESSLSIPRLEELSGFGGGGGVVVRGLATSKPRQVCLFDVRTHKSFKFLMTDVASRKKLGDFNREGVM